jgi:hypothetical protein
MPFCKGLDGDVPGDLFRQVVPLVFDIPVAEGTS